MSKWKPVAEMPANDELVLAYCPPDRLFPKGRMMIWKASFLARNLADPKQPDHLKFPATHYRPLPDPPEFPA